MRPTCPACLSRPVAVNCHKGDRVYYRKLCDQCIRHGKTSKIPPAWFKSGYRKKPQCEKCGFKFKFAEQSVVYYLDGNLKNNSHFNLKTVCLNCQKDVHKSQLPWKPSPLIPDF